MTMEQRFEQVNAASRRITRTLDDLRRDGFEPGNLYIALVDATVQLGRYYSPELSNYTLLKGLARLVLAMARDEKTQERKRHEKEH